MSSIISKLINLAGNITGTLPVANGGTGVTSSTGTVNVVLSNTPTLVTPVLGTPSSGNLSNCTNYPTATPTTLGIVSSYWPTIASGVLTTTNANYAILTTDGYETFLFSTGSSNRTLTLPTASANAGRSFKIIKIDSGVGQVQIVGTVNGSSSSTILNAINYIYGSCIITCDGTNYFYSEPITEQGTYTPTGTNGANTSVWTMNANTQFNRVGNNVTVSGVATITLTPSSNVAWNITLPITPVNFGNAQEAGGTSVNFGSGSGSAGLALQAVAVNGNTLIQFATNAGNGLASAVVNSFHFSYKMNN
jgi:hypothetical protein